MKDWLLAESKRVVELLTQLSELPQPPEYNRNWDWKDPEYKEYCRIKDEGRVIKSELKSRLTMLRKDCILVRKQIEKER